MTTPKQKDHPVIRPNGYNGYGFQLIIQDLYRRETLIECWGASIISHDHQHDRLTFTVRSSRRDFEQDSLYLLDAEFFGSASFIGEFLVFEGVFTRFLWRTEETVTEEFKLDPSGQDCYLPKGPFGERASMKVGPIQALPVYITAIPREKV